MARAADQKPVLRVGCAMWGLREWVGPYFSSAGNELAQYATWCNAVEGNTTFYGLPSERAVQSWAEAVPDGFRFAFKLPRSVTHDRRLRNAGPELAAFLKVTEPLGANLGPTSVQLPASFGPDDLPVLLNFLGELPSSRPWAVEVRNSAFFDGGALERTLDDELHVRGIDRVILDSRAVFAGPRITPAEIEAFANKPRLPVRATATSQYPTVRFIGQTDPEANPAFWEKWVPKVAAWIEQGREPTVFVHTPDNVAAIGLARRFFDEVNQLVEGLSPLPEPETAEQTQLFM